MSNPDEEIERNKHLTALYPEPTKSTYTSHQEPRPTLIGTVTPLSHRELFAIGFKISLGLATIFTVFAFFIDIGIGAFLFFFCSGALAILVTTYFAKHALEKFYYKNNFVKMSFALFITFYIISTYGVVAIMHAILRHSNLFVYVLIPILTSTVSGLIFVLFVCLSKSTISQIYLKTLMGIIVALIFVVSFVVN